MDKVKFVEGMQEAGKDFNLEYVDSVVDMCINRIKEKAEGSEACCQVAMALMEETGELAGALSHRVRGRTDDDYEILEEGADVVLDVLCACRLFGISAADLKKAIMVKCERETEREVCG